MKNNDNEVIGIDFGTTYSCVGLYKNNKSEIVKNEIGNNTTPSIVYIDKDNNFVGEKARSYQLKNQLNTIYDIKRLIGKKYSDKNVQEEIKHLLYNVIENKETKDEPMIEIETGETYYIEELASIIINQLKSDVETYIKKKKKN